MTENKFHISFKLNNKSFSSVDELLSYSKNFSEDISSFLESWFSNDAFIKVKTSGSTGVPKTIVLQKKQVVNSAKATGVFFDLKDNTKALLCLSAEYIAGKMMLVRALTLGWHLDVLEPNSNPLKGVSKAYDFAAMVPLQLENSIGKLNVIKKMIVGGGVVSNQLQEKLQFLKTEVYATYGMTETITHIAVKKLNNCSINVFNGVEKSFFKVLPNVEIFKDERSCLVIKALKVSDNVVFTNDVVTLISDIEFEWLGRFDNVINSGGIKLYPEKIEEKLSKVIKQRFFVASISDEKLGEKLVLIIEGKKKNINFKDTQLSKYEKPKLVFFVDNFIETETKKIQRKKTLDLIKF